MKTILALLSAACLCAHGMAHAQSTAPAAPKVPLPATAGSKLAAVAAKPGSGQTASLSESEGSNCPVDGNGDSQCVVVSSGSSSGGGGGYTPPEPGREPGGGMSGDGAGGAARDAAEKAKERARALCHSNYQEDMEHISKVFNASVEQHCGNLAQLKIGFKVGQVEAELDRIGAVIEELGRAFGRSCVSIASDTRNGAVAQKRETRRQCLADAEKG